MCLILTCVQVNLRLLCSVCYRTYVHYVVCIGSILFYYGFLALYSVLRPGALNKVGKSDNAYWVIFEVPSLLPYTLSIALHGNHQESSGTAWSKDSKSKYYLDGGDT